MDENHIRSVAAVAKIAIDGGSDIETSRKSIQDFGAGIRASVRALWRGEVDRFGFLEMMNSTLRRHLTQAWYEGAAKCGIKPEELSPEEVLALQAMVAEQVYFAFGFADAIIEGSRERRGLLGPLLTRAEMWTNRYNDAQSQATVMACADQKLEWVRGPTKDPCGDCLYYAGRVHRASVWAAAGARPQSHSLACGGRRCLCSLVPTDKPALPGRPPRPSGG